MPAYKSGRPRVALSAGFEPLTHCRAVRTKPILLRTGRGDSRLTPAECRELIAQLTAAYYRAIGAEAEAAHAAAHGPCLPAEGGSR